MNGLRVCVVSGFSITKGGQGGSDPLHADAYVYASGGRNVAHFHTSRRSGRLSTLPALDAELREHVRVEAEAWIAARDAA